MKISDEIYLELIRDTSAKGELFNDLLNVLNSQPNRHDDGHEEWEVALFNKIKFIKSQVTIHAE